jgi:hypothetical protein
MSRRMQKLYAVEYCTDWELGCSTFEIFKEIKEAMEFAKEKKDDYLYTFSAYFDIRFVFIEDDGHLNYDDCADLYDWSTRTTIDRCEKNLSSFREL